MAKTKLEVESTGWEELRKQIDAVVASGGQLVDQQKEIGAAQAATVSAGSKAQQEFLVNQRAIIDSKKVEASLTQQLTAAQVQGREKVAQSTKVLLDAVKALNAESGRQTLTSTEIVKKAQEMQAGYGKLVTTVDELSGGLEKIATDAGKAADQSKRIGDGTKEGAAGIAEEAAKAQFALDGMLQQQREIRKEVQFVQEGIAAGTIQQEKGLAVIEKLSGEYAGLTRDITAIKVALKDVGTQDGLAESLATANGALQVQVGLIEDLKRQIADLEKQKEAATTQEDIARINALLLTTKARLAELKKNGLPELKIDEAKLVAPVIALRTQLINAQQEAAVALTTFGEFSPEFKAAAERAAELQKRMGDVREAVNALNPEKKLEAIGHIATTLAGGFTAVAAGLDLIGVGTDNVAESQRKLLQGLALTQGLTAFFTDFNRSIKSIAIWMQTASGATKTFAAEQKLLATATGEVAVAQEGAAVATKGFTGAIGRMGAVLAANPILTAAAVIIGITVAMIALADNTENTKKEVDDLLASMEKLQATFEQTVDFLAQKQDLSNQLTFLKSAMDIQAERNRLEGDYQTLLDANTAKLQLVRDLAKKDVAEIQALRARGVKDEDESIQKLFDNLKALAKQESDLQNTLALIPFKAAADRQALANKQIEEARNNARERLRIEQDFQQALLAMQQKFGDSLVNASIDDLRAQATEAAHKGELDKEREFLDQITRIQEDQSTQAIDIAQRELERKLALIELEKQLGVQAIKDLGAAELQQRLDNLIDEGKVQLDPDQLEQFGILRNLIAARFERERTQNALKESEARIAIEDGELKQKLDFLKQSEDLAKAQLDNIGENRGEITQFLRDQGLTEVDDLKTNEQAKLAVLIDFAQKQIALLETSGNKADAIQAELLKKFVTDTQAELAKTKEFSFAKLLGLTDEEFQKLQPLIQQFGAFLSQSINNIFQAQLAANQAFVQLLEDRINAVQDAVAREQAAREEGLANNLDAEEAKLAILQQQREEALKAQARLAERQKAIETGLQIQQLLTGVAGLIKDSAIKGGVLGLAVAAGFIPILFALFKGAKTDAQAAAGFFKGVDVVDADRKHPAGRDQVPAMLNRGEHVAPTALNKEHRALYSGLYYDDPRLVEQGILHAAEHFGLMDKLAEHLADRMPQVQLPALDFTLPATMAEQKQRIETRKMESVLSPAIAAGIERIAANTRALLLHERTKETLTSHGDTLIIQKGDDKRFVTKQKPPELE